MCGIVGFLAKDAALQDTLGEFLVPMLTCMGERGPDSAGLAVFSAPLPASKRRFSLWTRDWHFDWASLGRRLAADTGAQADLGPLENHAILISTVPVGLLHAWLDQQFPGVHLLSAGRSIDLYKDEGHPAEIARRYEFSRLAGTHGIGHTRMATESAVSPAHAHPFTAGEDFCLVHNGSLSNPCSIRRRLEKQGIAFETDNDTEAACRFLEWRMTGGETLEQALAAAFKELDGFYTLLMATTDRMVLVRDRFACKPAVVAETAAYVAVGSEYRALAHLPDIRHARLFEPAPEQIYSWTAPASA